LQHASYIDSFHEARYSRSRSLDISIPQVYRLDISHADGTPLSAGDDAVVDDDRAVSAG